MNKISGKIIPLRNFSLMKPGSPIYYAENFGIENCGFGNVLVLKNEGQEVINSLPGLFGNMENINGIDVRKEGTLNYFWILSNGDIYLKSVSGSRDGDGLVVSLASHHSPYADIKTMQEGENGKILFSYDTASGGMLGRIHTGEATGGSDTSLVDNGVDFTTLGLVNGDTVYNITEGNRETITNITAHTLTLTGGADFASGDEYAIVDPNWNVMDANSQWDWGFQIIEFATNFYILNGDYLDIVDSAGVHSNQHKKIEEGWIARTGASTGDSIAIGANKSNKGKIFIWDETYDGWKKIINLSDEIQSIATWNNSYVYIAGMSLWITDGYNVRKLSDFPFVEEEDEFEVFPRGMVVIGNKIIINGGAKDSQLSKNGIWIYDIKREEWVLNPYEPGSRGNKVSYDIEGGIIFWESGRNEVWYSFINTGLGWEDPYILSKFDFGDTSRRGNIITNPIRLGKNAHIKKIEVNLLPYSKVTNTIASPTTQVSCRLSDCTRPIWRYRWTNADSIAKDRIKVNGTNFIIATAEIGDEVFIMNGWNGHLRRRIISWTNRGTNIEEWTLDSELDELTKNGTTFSIMPFQTYGMDEKTITEAKMLEFYPNFDGDSVMIELNIIGESHPKISIESILIYYE